MRISGKSSGVGTTQGTGAARPSGTPAAPAAGAGGGDALRVSGTAQFIAVARAALAKVPDIRSAKVNALKAKLDSDQYHPDGEAVADNLVREHTSRRRDP